MTQEATQSELEFFQSTHPWSVMHADGELAQQLGIDRLVGAMSCLLTNHIRQYVPEMKQKVCECYAAYPRDSTALPYG